MPALVPLALYGFNQCLGTWPFGELIRLPNGDVGVWTCSGGAQPWPRPRYVDSGVVFSQLPTVAP